MAEENGKGPAVGFNFSGEIMGTTYTYDEDAESPSFLGCIDALLMILNRKLLEQGDHV